MPQQLCQDPVRELLIRQKGKRTDFQIAISAPVKHSFVRKPPHSAEVLHLSKHPDSKV